MPPLITTRITTPDNSEVIRDRIAEILLVESLGQQDLAEAADPPESPDPWVLRIFTEASNPFEEWVLQDEPADAQAFIAPIVNVSLDNAQAEPRGSNKVSRQRCTGTYNVDCYGYGVSKETDEGHDPGDQRAALEAQRAARIVRQILMAGHYTYLGLPRGASQFVWGRGVHSLTVFKPAIDQRPVQRVMAVRLQFQVEFNEFSPQVEGEDLEVTSIAIHRKDTGEVVLRTQFGESSP